jgi:predicted DCC family thiol-disulfide oxidoreductase YuxK
MCSKLVFWILGHEAAPELRFAPLQGATAATARALHPSIPAALESFVFLRDGRAYLRSQAAFQLARHLRAPWRWSHALRVFPAFLFDPFYRLVAAVRYRIFGHADACALATPAQRARFLP